MIVQRFFSNRNSSENAAGIKSLVRVEGLSKSFGTQKVLDDLSFDLYEGENLVVLGKSGSGKSVLIKCIAGLIGMDKGRIRIFDTDIAKASRKEFEKIRQKIGFLFQSGALYDSMTVGQNIEFSLRRTQRKLSESMIRSKTTSVLEGVGLSDTLEKMPSQLSGGMRKRISLARAIVTDPVIMLYDEPTTGLDPVTSSEISTLINDVREKYKTTSVIITHDMKCAKATASRILILKDGKAYREGNYNDFEKSDDPFIRSFFE
jgi:phospholipid/cholesterol/gamma-HCH transport system ATP-binding protein